MVFDSLRRSLRNTFRRKSSRRDKGRYTVDGKKLIACKIALLDGTDVSINLQVSYQVLKVCGEMVLHLKILTYLTYSLRLFVIIFRVIPLHSLLYIFLIFRF